MRNSEGGTGIVIDGTNYAIKVASSNQNETGSIRVRQICDQYWQNCKPVSSLSTWSSIVIWWSAGNVCTMTTSNQLECNTDPTGLTSNSIVSITYSYKTTANPTPPSIGWNSSYTRPDSDHPYLWRRELITYADGSTPTTIITPLAMYSEWVSTFQLEPASDTTLWWIMLGYSQNGKNYPVELDQRNKAYVTVPRTEWNGGGWDSFWKTWNSRIYTENLAGGWGSSQNRTVLMPSNNLPLLFNSAFYHTWSFNFYTVQWNGSYWPATRITFDNKWIRIGGQGFQLFSGAWLSAGWAIVAWSYGDDNYIYMYASGNTNSSNKHFEIMWSKELAVGNLDWAYIYFNRNAYNSYDNQKYNVGINTKTPVATLDVKWSIRVWKDCVGLCDSSTVWTIVYYGNDFWWCRNDWNGVGVINYKRYSLTDPTKAPLNRDAISTGYGILCNPPSYYSDFDPAQQPNPSR